MLLCIDIGNTRLKWGVSQPEGPWLARGALALAALDHLDQDLRPWLGSCRLAVMACVAGTAVMDQVAGHLGKLACLRIAAQAEQCGVRNGYQTPAALGADRWAALIGARSLTRQPCIVVMAGTATTVDVLTAEGEFCGGLILPGLDLMRASLARDTAQLPWADGEVSRTPRCTADAIMSGCIHAQVGAIEHMYRAHAGERQPSNWQCLIGGGAAPALLPHLNVPYQAEPDLVMLGLAVIGDTPGLCTKHDSSRRETDLTRVGRKINWPQC